MRALVVDDSRAMRGILGRILKEIGFEVAEAANGKEALDRLDELGDPDVMLIDWNMPQMNGLELVQTVRAERADSDVLMMMVTTETDMSRVETALQAGANEYIMKPFTRDAIVEKLELLGLLVQG